MYVVNNSISIPQNFLTGFCSLSAKSEKMPPPYACEEITEEELIITRAELLEELRDVDCLPEVPSEGSESATGANQTEYDHNLYNHYREYYSKKYSKPAASTSEWKWLESVNHVVKDLDSCLDTLSSDIDNIENENRTMTEELSGLDEKSKELLSEQSKLEKQVAELESKMNIVGVVRDANTILNNRDLIITNLSIFERSVDGLSKAFAYIATSPSPDAMSLNRQFEHLRSRICSLSTAVSLSAIDMYATRLQQSLFTGNQTTINTSVLYTKHVDTIRVVGNICRIFRQQSSHVWSDSLSEIDKAYFGCRVRILTPVITSFINSTLTSTKLSDSVRKCVFFVNSILAEEMQLASTIVGGGGGGGLTSELKSQNFFSLEVSNMLYAPLRTAIISSLDLYELRESAEVIRLEIVTDEKRNIFSYIMSILFKLHRDIQERLIYRIESFIRDEIRLGITPVEKTYECLGIITGVLDAQIFHQISTEAVNACVDVLVAAGAATTKTRTVIDLMTLISQLLDLRERITIIDCEYSLVSVSSPSENSDDSNGMTGTIRKLVGRGGSSTPASDRSARGRIEKELKKLCDEFSANIIATIAVSRSIESVLEYIDDLRSKLLSQFKDPSIEAVLLRPVVMELRSGSAGVPMIAQNIDTIAKAFLPSASPIDTPRVIPPTLGDI